MDAIAGRFSSHIGWVFPIVRIGCGLDRDVDDMK